MSKSIEAVQRALARHGFNPGEIDGVWGRRTMTAVRAFQRAHRLKPDGIVGPLTAERLFGVAASASGGSPPALVWREEARRLVGTREVPGTGSNRTILEWAADLDIDYADDDIPWCGLFVAHCIGATLPQEVLPRHPLRARAWARFGEHCTPMTGAVMVFWRESETSGKGHVGFYEGQDEGHFYILGGNQSNRVNIAKISRSRLLTSRWPSTAGLLTGQIAHMSDQMEVSVEEA